MWFDLFVLAAVLVIGEIYFGHFNDLFPKWRRLRKITVIMVTTALLSLLVGHWSLLFIGAMALVGSGYHWWWCRKHGIDPFTAEPRDKFEALVRDQYNLREPV